MTTHYAHCTCSFVHCTFFRPKSEIIHHENNGFSWCVNVVQIFQIILFEKVPVNWLTHNNINLLHIDAACVCHWMEQRKKKNFHLVPMYGSFILEFCQWGLSVISWIQYKHQRYSKYRQSMKRWMVTFTNYYCSIPFLSGFIVAFCCIQVYFRCWAAVFFL